MARKRFQTVHISLPSSDSITVVNGFDSDYQLYGKHCKVSLSDDVSINEFGTKEQKQKYLPKLAIGEYIGCFGLTEPDHGSDPAGMSTRAKKVAGGYRLKGSKMWITNSPIADVFVVWAKEVSGEGNVGDIRGFILEKGWQGLSAPAFTAKWGCVLRLQGEIVMDDVFVPEENALS